MKNRIEHLIPKFCVTGCRLMNPCEKQNLISIKFNRCRVLLVTVIFADLFRLYIYYKFLANGQKFNAEFLLE